MSKVWAAIDRLMMIQKSDLSSRVKWKYFQAVALSVLLYGCTWTLMKSLEKNLHGNYSRILQLYGHFSSHKPSKKDKQEMLDTAGERKMNS